MEKILKTALLIILFTVTGVLSGMQAETKRALLVGISDYGNDEESSEQWSNINGANDVVLLTPLLKTEGFTVRSLVDEKATYSAIICGTGSNNFTTEDALYLGLFRNFAV